MIQKFTQLEFDSAKSTDLLKLECEHCHIDFYCQRRTIKYAQLNNFPKYCSHHCGAASKEKRIVLDCMQCKKTFTKKPSGIGVNNFCTQSCAATYNNKHKSHGTRISKLEVWLQEQLTILYPNLEIHYNRKDAINSELDIYIPSLKLAFELNGIFHYEPVFGVDKLIKVQNNDISKSKACFDNQIDLCIIDTSGQKYVTPSTSTKYLNIIVNILDNYNV